MFAAVTLVLCTSLAIVGIRMLRKEPAPVRVKSRNR